MRSYRSVLMLSVMITFLAASGMALSLEVPEGVNATGFEDETENEENIESKLKERVGQKEENKTDIKKNIKRKLQQEKREIKEDKEKKSEGFITGMFHALFG